MNKKIISLLMSAAMLATSATAFATTEGIIQGDVMMTSAEGIVQDDIMATSGEEAELNTFTGVVKAIEETRITVEIEGVEYAFILAEGVELGEIKVGDTVELTSASVLKTKDIKEAASIKKVDAETETDKDEESAVPEVSANNYNSYNAVVSAVEDGTISVTIEEDMVVNFKVTEDTVILSMDGETAEVKKDDKVIVVSTSLLNTKDIKFATAIIINNEEKEQSVYYDKFDVVDEQLISDDGNLVLNVEDTKEYAGKELVVFYSMQTMSIPAQTTPEKIVVIEKEESAPTVTISFNVGNQILDINNAKVELEVAPYIVGEGVTLVPLRVISEAFGAEVAWDGETKTVTIVDGETTINVVIGSKTTVVNGEEKALEEAPELLGSGVTMVPLRFISETLGAEVGYVHETQLITVAR